MDTAYTYRMSTWRPSTTHHFGWNVQNLENLSLPLGYFSLKAAYISLRLHRKRRFMNSFCNDNVVFFTRHFIWWLNSLFWYMLSTRSMVFWDITFPCFCAGYARIPLTFLSSLAVLAWYSETLKCSAQYQQDHESGASVKICIFSEYVAVVNFSFMKFCKWSSSVAFCSVLEITLTDSELASWPVLTT